MQVVRSADEEQTREIGRILGRIVGPGTVIALSGELGAGKTVLAQGLAEGLGVKGPVSSPSFVIMNVYRGRCDVYHFDFYRLQNAEELEELGLEEYYYSEGVTIIEWSNKFAETLPPERLQIELVRDDRDPENARFLYFKAGSAVGALFEKIVEELKKRCLC